MNGMGILSFLTDIFESVFMSSSPEVKKKQALHKIDSELRALPSGIYRGGFLQPNFAELFRILFENSKILDDLFSQTICGSDVKRSNFYESQLMLTGFSNIDQEKLEKLNLENRKQEVIDSNMQMTRVFENQKHTMEFLLKELNSQEFFKIDEIIASLQQLADICKFNFLNIIHNFDPNYSGVITDTKPMFFACVPDVMLNSFQDFYYLTAHFKITTGLGRAVVAVAQIQHGRTPLTDKDSARYMEALKKINSVLTKYLTPEIMLKVIRLAKHDPEFNPQIANYKANARQKFATFLKERFVSDEARIKAEIKDRTIEIDVQKLFEEVPLEELNGYNAENSNLIHSNCTKSYIWVTPLQVEKTFIKIFYTEEIQTLLNDLVIEGFFENSAIKTAFSSAVYACAENINVLENFEKSFDKGGSNDQAIIEGFIRDGRRDADFIKKLEKTIDGINEQAFKIVQETATQFFELYKHIHELFIDSKKAKPDICSNIKVLLGSSRNRENTSRLEVELDKWAIFLDILKNYAVVGEVERK